MLEEVEYMKATHLQVWWPHDHLIWFRVDLVHLQTWPGGITSNTFFYKNMQNYTLKVDRVWQDVVNNFPYSPQK